MSYDRDSDPWSRRTTTSSDFMMPSTPTKFRRSQSPPSDDASDDQMSPKFMSKIRIEAPLLREILAEFLATFILVLFGDASVAQSVLSGEKNGDFFSINWGWGLGVMMGVLIAGRVSGAHLNPAVTLAMAIFGRFPWIKVLFYWAAQYLGALAAAASVLGVYSEAIHNKTGGSFTMLPGDPGTAGIFATYPAPYLSTLGGLGDQILGTFLLLLCVCAITDKKNGNVSPAQAPIYVGMTIIAIGACFGVNCGYAINPARDLAPRVLTWFAGWGTDVFTYGNYWFWVPIVGPHIGAVLGVAVYILFIEAHWPDDGEPDAYDASRIPRVSNSGAVGGRPEKSPSFTMDMERL